MSKKVENMNQRELLEEYNQALYRIKELERMLFGSKSERFIAEEVVNQLRLPFDIKPVPGIEKKQEQITYTRTKASRENHMGRNPLPDHLPVVEIYLDPEQDTTGMKCIGKEITDKLEYKPGKVYIKRYIRLRFIKEVDQELEKHEGVIAELPSFPIEKGIAGSGLLSQIMIDKFVDHLPIYRQIERFKREDIKISSSTINNWQDAVCHLLEPLYDTLKHRVLSQGYIQVDETPIQVLDKTKKGKTHKGYYWVYYSPFNKEVLFDYRTGRGRNGPEQLLKDFEGYLQTDGYKVYDFFDERKKVTQLNCMAHARRYFEKALPYDEKKAEYALSMFQKLYAIERKAAEENMTPEQRFNLRQKEAVPVLEEFTNWIKETNETTLPKSVLGKAFAYCIPRWSKLTAYLKDGELLIDNNLVENAIRPVAIGRKNYLFAGSGRGAERAAMFYSFFGTCKKNNVNPFEWLKTVLERIPDHKVTKLDELLPYNLKL
jgi:transposase